jgi:hypothetical protein
MLDKGEPLTLWRALRAPEFWLLAVTGCAGAAGLAWWVVLPLAVAGLSMSSLPKYVALWPRARAAGAAGEWWKTVGLSMLNNAGAAAGCFVLGVVARWVWW